MRLFQGKGRTALMGVIGMLALLVAACGNSSSSTTTGNNGGNYDFNYNFEQPSGNSSGTIIFGEYQAPGTLNPYLFGAEVEAKNVNLLWDSCLVQLPNLTLGPQGFQPDQCNKVPDESADGKTTTLHLDPNAKWSDGQPITANDYVFGYDILTDPNVLGSPFPYNYMTSFKPIDQYTIKETWSVPFAAYELFIPSPLPAHIYPKAFSASGKYSSAEVQNLVNADNFNTKFAADNGPYTLVSFSPDTIVYQKNPNFHSNFFHGPFANKIIFKSTGDVNTSIEDFKTGGLDQVDDFKLSDVASFAGIPQNEQVTSPLLSYDFLGFNQRPQALNAQDPNNPTHKSVFTNAMFRKAIFEAINVCAGIVTILGDPQGCNDKSVYATEFTANPAYDFDPSFTPTPYNLTQAKADLQAAGFPGCKYSNGKTILLNLSTTNGNPTRLSYLALVGNALSQLGCKFSTTTYVAVPNYFGAIAQGGILATGKFDISLHGFVNSTDPSGNDSLFDPAYIPGAKNNPAGIGGNEDGINDPKITQLIQQATQALDFNQRKQDYSEVQREVIQNWYGLPLYLDPNITLVSPSLHNYKLNPGSVGNTWNIADWWSSANRTSSI